jgi:hypothetical protein
MDKDITGFGEKNPMRDVVKFAADKSSAILTTERKRLAQIADQCARSPLDQTRPSKRFRSSIPPTGILTAIRDRL